MQKQPVGFTQALALVLCIILFSGVGAGDEARLVGFSADSSRVEKQWEEKFRSLPNPGNMRDSMKRLSAHPHHVGTAADKENAEWILRQFQEWGWDAHIESFDVLFPTPARLSLEMLWPAAFKAKIDEPPIAADPTSNQKSEQLPTYNAYSADGDVTGPLVYVNYGLPEDYEELERLGVSVKGAIAIARYGNSWRGVKPKLAAEHGAIGCLIFSDPKDDGYFVDEVYPNGPMRPKAGVQRGSVMDFASSSPGDPLTPGWGATKDARRIDLKEAKSITKIPVLPISYGDAEPLLAALKGPVAPGNWRGALPITYHVGAPEEPRGAKVHLVVKSNWDIKTVYDVIAKLPGATEPGQWVVRGNHHDAWVNGAQDPVSGLAALLEEARALGELVKQGWKPQRTIIYCVWDGEEPFLLGSTEWVETHADELREHAAIYINTDGNARGFLIANGSHSLEPFINDISRDIQDPEANVSVSKRLQMYRISTAKSDSDREELRKDANWRLAPLGAGSDFTAFLDHAGVPSLDLSFGGETPDGIYHSIYDDFYWYTHFADTDFVYGKALAQLTGSAVMRMADGEILPFDFAAQARAFKKYSDDLKKLLSDKRQEILERNQEIDEGVFAAVNDPQHPRVTPSREKSPPFLNFARLDNALAVVEQSSSAYEKALHDLPAMTSIPFEQMNGTLISTERQLLSSSGLPRRPWYQHLIYAPGIYSGYDAKTMPGVREAIEQKRYAEADEQIIAIADALRREAEVIDHARELLQSR